MPCTHCTAGGADVFVGRLVRREQDRYRKKGPTGTTRLLLYGLRHLGVEGSTVLDIGGGVGVIAHELVAAGARSAVEVEASPEYVEAARKEIARRDTGGRVRVVEGDFVDLAAGLPPADVVTLDRSICCYPHMRRLVAASAESALRLYGTVLPREHILVRIGVWAVNLVQRLRGSAFRVYLHRQREVEEELRSHGFRRAWQSRTWLWRVRIYRRVGPRRRDLGADPSAIH